MTKKLLNPDLFAYLLVLLAMRVFVVGLAGSLPGISPDGFFQVSLAALVLGWFASQRQWKPLPSCLALTGVGAAGLWVIGAGLASLLVLLLRDLFALLPQIIPALRYDLPLDVSSVHTAWLAIAESSGWLAGRFQTWFSALIQNASVNDALISNLIWLYALWLLACWMGWFSARRNSLAVLLPPLLILAPIISYTGRRVDTIWALVVILPLLMGLWNYKRHFQEWISRRVDYAESIAYDSTQSILLLTLLIGFVAFVTPSISWEDIRRAWQARQESQEITEALGIPEQEATPPSFTAPQPLLPEHRIGGPSTLSPNIVLMIRPEVHADPSRPAPRYYWRNAVFDEYTGSGWTTSRFAEQSFAANSPLLPGSLRNYRVLNFHVETRTRQNALFWSGLLASADVPLTAQWRLAPTAELFPSRASLLQADLFSVPSTARAYTVRSFLPDVSSAKLSEASTDYPEEIRQRYLQLPPLLPERVYELARRITSDYENPYDQAKAIEYYLRSTYPYELNVPAPSPNQDVTDYFLFDLKQGYCDHFATAMVVLARAGGLPARFVSGYAPGEYDPVNARYIIRDRDSHSWAEVYFSDIGWIEFEPTASLPSIAHGQDQSLSPDETNQDELSPKNASAAVSKWLRYLLNLVAASILMLIFYFAWLEKLLYARLAPSLAIGKIYQQLYRAGRPLAGGRANGETALAFSGKLIEAVTALASYGKFRAMLPGLQRELATLTETYNLSLFCALPVAPRHFQTAWRAWSRLRWRLWLAKTLSAIKRIQRQT